MHALLTVELARCRGDAQSQIRTFFVPLERTSLKWEYGDCEEFEAWIFADMRERSVLAAYCLGGHGALGSPWGLIFRNDSYFGMHSGWFRSLRELFEDWGVGASEA
jgi:hypothetical protein